MKRSGIIRTVTFVTAALVIAAVFAITGWIKVAEYKMSYELTYRRAFTELVDSVTKIDSELSKSLYSNSSPLLVTMANNISRYSESAKSALGILPTSDMSLEKTSAFISQVGDFSITLARKAAGGTKISQDEYANLSTLSQTASSLSAELSELYLQIDNEGFFSASSAQALRNAENAEENANVNFSGGLSNLEMNLPESPVLIYDGPYSNHIVQSVPQYLMRGDAEVSQDQAAKKAAAFLDLPASALTFAAKTSGDRVVYIFSIEGDMEGYISVTAVGGNIISLTGSYVPGAATIDGAQAVTIGAQFLAQKGYEKMVSSYFYTVGGICYINYEYAEGEVVIYPDLIQLGVALDNGKVVYMDAGGYLNNNRAGRELTPGISAEEAAGALSADMTVRQGARLCVIPSLGKNEILCYEFECQGENENSYLIYVNAKTGIIENIFLLVEDENGTLTV